MRFERLDSRYIPEVAAIEREAMAEPWSENMLLSELENPSSTIIVGVEGGKVICYGGFRRTLDEADILNIAVIKEMRGQGIGGKLLARLISEAKSCGVNTLTLEVSEQNTAAIALYTRCGFEKVGVRKRYYMNSFDALIMRLKLGEGVDKT